MPNFVSKLRIDGINADIKDASLTAALSTEISNREAAVTAERTAREAADTALRNAIDAEEDARAAADTNISNSVSQQISAAESRLSQQITEEVQEAVGDAGDGIGGALKGKKIAVLGDSLTIGSGNALGHTWVENLARDYGAITYNYGVSGSKISSGGSGPAASDMVTRIDSILAQHDSLDYFILSGGANDKNESVNIGSLNASDNNTFVGAIKNIINKVKNKYEGSCKILLMTTYHRYDTYNNIGRGEQDYVEGMIRAGNFWSIPVFNNYNNCGINLSRPSPYQTANEWADIYYSTGSENPGHFSVEGYEYLTPIYANWIVNAYNTNTGSPLNTLTSGNDIYNRVPMAGGLSLVTVRHYFSSTSDGGQFGPNYWTKDLSISIPARFRVNSPIINISFKADAGLGAVALRAFQQDSGGYVSEIKFRACREGGGANEGVAGLVFVTMIGYTT